jgi:hypothetical protein
VAPGAPRRAGRAATLLHATFVQSRVKTVNVDNLEKGREARWAKLSTAERSAWWKAIWSKMPPGLQEQHRERTSDAAKARIARMTTSELRAMTELARKSRWPDPGWRTVLDRVLAESHPDAVQLNPRATFVTLIGFLEDEQCELLLRYLLRYRKPSKSSASPGAAFT